MNRITDGVLKETVIFFSGDPKRIQHFIKVHSFASYIGRCEGLSEKELLILEIAAITHDIGIRKAEELYGKGNCTGKMQEQFGPADAEKILRRLGTDEDVIERVSFLISHHHTYTGVDSSDWQILLEADFLVNSYEDGLSAGAVFSAAEKLFKTKTGLSLLKRMYDR